MRNLHYKLPPSAQLYLYPPASIFTNNKNAAIIIIKKKTNLECDQPDQEAGWAASGRGCCEGLSQREGEGGRWKSKACVCPRGRAGEGKDQQT